MAVAIIDVKKEDELQDVTRTATGGTVTNDVRVTYEDALTTQEIVLALDNIKEFVLQNDVVA